MCNLDVDGVKQKKSSSSDDYGFLAFQKTDSNRQPRITIRAHSPRSEVRILS